MWKQDSGRKKHLKHWESKLKIMGKPMISNCGMLKITHCRSFKRRLNTVYCFNNKEKNGSLLIITIIFFKIKTPYVDENGPQL